MTPALVAASAEAAPVCAIENTELILVTQAALLHSPSFALLEGRPEPARLPPRRCLFLNGDELMARGWRDLSGAGGEREGVSETRAVFARPSAAQAIFGRIDGLSIPLL